jgi:hypothetical protein
MLLGRFASEFTAGRTAKRKCTFKTALLHNCCTVELLLLFYNTTVVLLHGYYVTVVFYITVVLLNCYYITVVLFTHSVWSFSKMSSPSASSKSVPPPRAVPLIVL